MRIIVIVLLFAGVYFYGHHQGYSQKEAEDQIQIAKLNEEARKTETVANQRVADISTKLEKAQADVQEANKKRDVAIRSGSMRLFVPVKAPICPGTNAPATERPDTANAQLDPAFAQSVVTITDDGDTAIRKLNACITVYNQVREMLNGTATTK